MTTPPRLLAGRMPEASTPSRRYRCAASSLTASSLQARVRHEARGFSVRKPSDETQRQHSSITERLHLKFAAGLFKEWGPPLTIDENVNFRNGLSTKCRKSSDLPDYSYKKFAVDFSQWLVLQELGHDRSEFRSNWKPRAHIDAKFQKCTNWVGRNIVRLHPLLLHPFLNDDVQHQNWLQRHSASSEFRDSNHSCET